MLTIFSVVSVWLTQNWDEVNLKFGNFCEKFFGARIVSHFFLERFGGF